MSDLSNAKSHSGTRAPLGHQNSDLSELGFFINR
jgi:hypothetical protein